MPPITRTGAGTGVPSTATTTPDGRYPVAAGDTLNKIAARFGVTVDALVTANQRQYPKISDEKSLQVGWQLQIPGAAQNPAPPPPPAGQRDGWKPRSNDKVLFVAVNNSPEHQSTDEAKAMINRGVDVTVVHTSDVGQDQVAVKDKFGNSKTYDLTKPEGAMGFALTLGLPAEQTKKIADTLSKCEDGGRDEVAGMAQEWAKAERGGQTESRLVMSGHQTGTGVYGDNNGKIRWDTLADLARAMPRGAASVEDLMIAGCFSGGDGMMQMYQDIFPNLKTAVAYDGLSPGAASGAVAHQKAWEQATRGDRATIDRNIFNNFRWGDHVAVWSKAGGYQNAHPETLDQARNRVQYRYQYDAALNGQSDIGDPTTGPVRQFYTDVQHLLQRSDLPAEEKPALTELKDQAIRLVFYGQVAGKFNQAHAAEIQQGFQAMGLPVPDFSKLSRADAVKAIDAFQAAIAPPAAPTPADGSTPAADGTAPAADGTAAPTAPATPKAPPPAAAVALGALLTDFRALKTNVIPESWV
jgi:LysM repeat protein